MNNWTNNNFKVERFNNIKKCNFTFLQLKNNLQVESIFDLSKLRYYVT